MWGEEEKRKVYMGNRAVGCLSACRQSQYKNGLAVQGKQEAGSMEQLIGGKASNAGVRKVPDIVISPRFHGSFG